MAKLTTTPINSRYGSIDALNDNFDLIEEAMEKTLSRTGDEPNYMEANLDMNSNSILNANIVNAQSLTVNGVPIVPGSTGTVAEAGQVVFQFSASGGQTTFDVTPYTPSSQTILVFVNGLLLPPTSITINGSDVVLPALELLDEVNIIVFAVSPTPAAIYNYTSFIPVKTIATTTHTITTADFGYYILFDNASPITVTINEMNGAFSSNNGAVMVFCQRGAGQVTVQAGTGVTIFNPATAKTRAQYSVTTLQCIAVDTWVMSGDVELV